MLKLKLSLLVITIIIMSAAILLAQDTTDARIKEIVKKMDELYRSESSYAVMEMQIVTPHWERTMEMEAWSLGMDKTFILVTSPDKDAGMATLRIDNEMWNYLPKTDKVIKIPPSMMMGSWMGSDFTNDDLVRETSMLEDYDFSLITPDDAEKGFLYVQLIPYENVPVVWGKIIAKIRKDDYIPVKEEFYDEKGELMRVMNFKEIKEMGGKVLPTVMELIPQNKEGNTTVVIYKEARFNVKVPKEVFTLRNLKKGK